MGVNEIDFANLSAAKGLSRGLQAGAQLGNMYRQNRLQDSELERRNMLEAQDAELKENQRLIDDMARDAGVALEIQDPDELQAFLQRRVDRIKANGGDPSDTLAIMGLPPAQLRQELQRVYQKAAPVSTLGKSGVNVRSQQIYKDGTVIQSTDSGTMVYNPSGKLVKGDEAAKTLKTASEFEINFAGEQNYSRQTGTNMADVDSGGDAAESRKFGELQGQERANAISKGSERLTTIRSTVSNLKRGLEAIKEGASSGVISNRLSPIVRASTVKLRDVQNALTLDVLNAATFGALSATELDLAQQTALPTDLPPNELRAHIKEKIIAQEKLADYFNEQIKFLNNGGSVAEFVTRKQDEYANKNSGETTPKTGANTFTSNSGITFEVN